MVVVTELSKDPESHLHRVGRTGRAGQEGIAISLVEPREENRLRRVENFYSPGSYRPGADRRVYRGGSWYDNADFCAVSLRYNSSPFYRYNGLGFRFARSVR